MSFESALTPEERNLLKELPFKVILAAVVADVRGPIGAARKESAEGAHTLVASAMADYPGNALILGVLQDVANDPATEKKIALKDDEARHGAIVEALRISSEGAALLAQIEDQEQAAQYKEWVVRAAKAATEATRSGSILNISHVSDAEEDFLRQLQVALGLITDEPESEGRANEDEGEVQPGEDNTPA